MLKLNNIVSRTFISIFSGEIDEIARYMLKLILVLARYREAEGLSVVPEDYQVEINWCEDLTKLFNILFLTHIGQNNKSYTFFEMFTLSE
jgi:hypothetical protein